VSLEVSLSEDAAAVLRDASAFLEARPIEHNLILTLLHQRARSGEPGRYWTVRADGEAVGLVLQSPPGYRATITPMAPVAARAAAAAIAEGGFRLPGVEGEAGTAAAFAGQWTESCHIGAQPVLGTRLQRLGRLTLPEGAEGGLRTATESDLPLVQQWWAAFANVSGNPVPPDEVTARRIESGDIAMWEVQGAPVSAAGCTQVVAGVSRIQPVYTPPDLRRHGYAAACVGHLSKRIVDLGHSCVLYTDLGNPTSNSVYRSLGYETVCENIRYEFAEPVQT
jgi:predicted GNAT family acetyltransferase